MPRGDGTGPMGMGSMTGRGAGYCAGNDVPGFSSTASRGFGGRGRGTGPGRGRGFGRGLGRGLCWLGAVAAAGVLARHISGAASKTDEKAMLTEQAGTMERTLADIKRRLSELED